MSELFNIQDTTANKISYYHLLLFMASLPFDMFYSHVILISYAIHTLINLNKTSLKRLYDRRILILQSVFMVTLLSTIYTIKPHEAFQAWGGQITIFLIPIVFWINPFDVKKYRLQLLTGFALVCTATIAYLFIDALITIRHYHLPFIMLFSGAFTNHNFSEPINIHATFFSMQVVIALVYLLSLLVKEAGKYKKLFYLLCCTVLLAGIIQLSSKSIFVVLAVVINVAFPYFLLTGKKRVQFIITSITLTMLIAGGITFSGNLRERYITSLTDDLSKSVPGQTTDTRLARWQVTYGLIKRSPVIGYGAGSEIGLLQDGFYQHKLYNSYLNKLNTHSEYLSFLLKSGIIGLLIYWGTLTYGFRAALLRKDIFLFTFMLLIAVVSLSENLLDVDKGIIFYAFFFTFFVVDKTEQSVDYQTKQSKQYFAPVATNQVAVASYL
jgi:O-antigen ligase